MALVVALLCFSGVCWAIVIFGLRKRRMDPLREKAADDRRSAEVYSLARERFRRRRLLRGQRGSKSQ